MFQQSFIGQPKPVGRFAGRKARQADLFSGLGDPIEPARDPLPGQTSFLSDREAAEAETDELIRQCEAELDAMTDDDDDAPVTFEWMRSVGIATPVGSDPGQPQVSKPQVALPGPARMLALPAPEATRPKLRQARKIDRPSLDYDRPFIVADLKRAIALQDEMVKHNRKLRESGARIQIPYSKADLHKGRNAIAKLRAKLRKLGS